MPTSRRVSLCFALSLLLACGPKTGGQTGDEDTLPSGEELFGELGKRAGTMNYEPAHNVAELTMLSERVIVGRAVALRSGRTLDAYGPGVRTVVLELEVEQTLKGPRARSLNLEFMIGVEDAAPPKQLPTARVIAFATPAQGSSQAETEMLYQLTTPQGLVVESSDGGFTQPLEPSDRALGDGDFAALIPRIQAATMGSDATDAGVQGASDASADAGLCQGELPFPSSATPISCPAQCAQVRASPFSSASNCIDYPKASVIGCTEGEGPPVVVCVERSDGQRFQIGSGWPFPMSTTYKLCSDEVTMTVTQAPSCP